MCVLGNGKRDLGEVGVHGSGVGVGHGQRSGSSAFMADGAENLGPGIAGVARGARATAARGPDASERAPLVDPRLVSKPDLQGLAPDVFREGVGYGRGEVFLNASWASGSDFGCCGRTERRRNPSAANCLPTVRSCMATPKRASILR